MNIEEFYEQYVVDNKVVWAFPDNLISTHSYEFSLNKYQNDPNNVNNMYFVGLVSEVRGEYNDARKFYKMAISQGCPRSMFCLARLYDLTNHQDNIFKTEKYLIMASDHGFVQAMTILAGFYDAGTIPTADHRKSTLKYYLMAASHGDVNSMVYAGNIYANMGEHAKEEYWYKKALVKGCVAAMFNLGLLYIDIDLFVSTDYFNMAIAHGYDEAAHKVMENFRQIQKTLTQTENIMTVMCG
jgi:TPR repeat protein